MTDTHAPTTGEHPAPMFDTDAQPSLTPNTEPHPAPIFDTGPHPDPLQPLDAEHQAFSRSAGSDTDPFLGPVDGYLPPAPPVVIPAQPVAVTGSFQFVKRWRFVLIVAAVWVIAAAAGLGFYFWWYTSLDKTLPVFGILVYVVAAMAASLLVSLVPNRPQVTALAIALMAAPLASVAAAAILHGAYYFEWIARPAIG